VKRLVDLGMLADIDEACAAYRAWDRAGRKVGCPPVSTRLGRAMGRLNRTRRYYSRLLRERSVRGDASVGRLHVEP